VSWIIPALVGVGIEAAAIQRAVQEERRRFMAWKKKIKRVGGVRWQVK